MLSNKMTLCHIGKAKEHNVNAVIINNEFNFCCHFILFQQGRTIVIIGYLLLKTFSMKNNSFSWQILKNTCNVNVWYGPAVNAVSKENLGMKANSQFPEESRNPQIDKWEVVRFVFTQKSKKQKSTNKQKGNIIWRVNKKKKKKKKKKERHTNFQEQNYKGDQVLYRYSLPFCIHIFLLPLSKVGAYSNFDF